MNSARPAPDQAARDRIRGKLDRNFLVEAGAGSGKTAELTNRMAAGIASGDYALEHMAAVTFTRKAAAELRGRFQLALEAELAGGGPEARRTRVVEALSRLERFFSGTIHAFCGRLLRERPVEAGVSPGFTELDDIEERIVREQSWRDFRVQAKVQGDADLVALTDAGINARQLDKAFETVCLYEDVTFPGGAARMPDPAAAWDALETFWRELGARLPSPFPDGYKCDTLRRADRFAREWRAWLRGRRDAVLLTHLMRQWEAKPSATPKWWPRKADAHEARDLHEAFRVGTVQPYLTAWRRYLYGRCITLLTKARDHACAERRRRNTLSFNDLLLLTAAVLRQNAGVRRALQDKYRFLFVDEFQDTDPVQAEIMFLLAAEEPTAPCKEQAAAPVAGSQRRRRAAQPGLFDGAMDAVDWRRVRLRPGALFVVGDPKQSIYRFRRADIDIYNDVRRTLAGDDGQGVVSLTTNFRSVPGLCEWANDVFRRRFPAEPTREAPMFGPLVPARAAAAAEAASRPCIAAIDIPASIDAADVARDEAARIARYIRAEVASGRRQYGDFLILTRKKKGLRPAAEALEAIGVPIEVTGAGAFGDSDEVRELALLLKALVDPQDAVALVGVLRGALFGLSDRDLFAFREAGAHVGLFAHSDSADEGARRVASALEALRRWHDWTRKLPAGAALERVLADSGYLALAAVARGGVEAGDLLHAVYRVRAAVAKGFTLADAADALAGWCALDGEEPEDSTDVDSLPLEPGRPNVVRLMNLHKAKGLEATVVFLADPLGGYEPQVDIRIAREGGDAFGYFKLVEEGKDNRPPRPIAEPEGWDRHYADELRYVTAEFDRLFYVAATRAKELVVMGRYAGAPGRRHPAWQALSASLSTAPALVIPDEAPPAAALEPLDADEAMAAAALAAAARHEHAVEPTWTSSSVTAELKRLPLAAAAADTRDDPTVVVVPRTPSHRADAGLAWGSLVHGLLEHAMRHRSSTIDDLRRLARWLTMDEPALGPLIDQAIATALAVVSSAELAEARAAAECHEEVPFAVRDVTTRVPRVVTGAIDLVHRAGDGWRIVDYKTDVGLDDREAQQKYFAQVRAYADAWRRVAGPDVRAEIVPVRK